MFLLAFVVATSGLATVLPMDGDECWDFVLACSFGVVGCSKLLGT